MKLWAYIYRHMMNHPRQTIHDKSFHMTYEEFCKRVLCFSEELKGIDTCVIYCRSELLAAIAILACFVSGTTAVPLPTRYGEKYCRKIIQKVSPAAIIMDCFDQLSVHCLEKQTPKGSDKPALIMCTSGTTGSPKGIQLSQDNILANVRDIASYFNINNQDSILIARPLFHCAVLTGELLVSLVKGTKIMFYSDAILAPSIYRTICNEKITVFCGTPTLINMMTRFIRHNDSNMLKHMVISGECMSAETGKNIRRHFPDTYIYHVYGLTEAGPRVSFLPPEHFDETPDAVGIPLPSVQLKILNCSGQAVQGEEHGLLWVKGPNVMTGYFNDPKKTQDVLKDGWLCTGDIAYVDRQGWLHIKGRYDNMIIRAGMNIYPQEIETAVKKDPRTKDVLVFGERKKSGDVQVCMKISGDFSDVQSVREMCGQILPVFQIPTQIDLVQEIPKTQFGKIARSVTND